MHGVIGQDMSRAGRKRKSGKRYASGDLVPARAPDDRIRAARQPHRRCLDEAVRLDERAESPLGRLLLRGLLATVDAIGTTNAGGDAAAARYDAGCAYVAVTGAYRAVIEAPTSTSGSGRGFGCAVEQTNDADTCRRDPDGCGCLRRKQRYDGAFEALVRRAGMRAARAVARVAVHREDIPERDLPYLVAGLDALAHHFGLTRTRSRGYLGNAN